MACWFAAQPPLAATQAQTAGASSATPAPAQAAGSIKVTPETYIRAETDRSFHNIEQLAGGVNRLYHFRSPTPLDKQTVVRMNKDTLYSAGVVDTAGGATITLPEVPPGRYMSILLIDNDHYAPSVIYTPGTHQLPTDTKYLVVAVRTQLFNPNDPAEVALVNKLQDQVVIQAKSADPITADAMGFGIAESADRAIRKGFGRLQQLEGDDGSARESR